MKICFALINQNEKNAIACAYEDESGNGSYIACDAEEFKNKSMDKQIETLNNMIVAVSEAHKVKTGIKFSDYQRQ